MTVTLAGGSLPRPRQRCWTADKPSACGMLVYNDDTSPVKRMRRRGVSDVDEEDKEVEEEGNVDDEGEKVVGGAVSGQGGCVVVYLLKEVCSKMRSNARESERIVLTLATTGCNCRSTQREALDRK